MIEQKILEGLLAKEAQLGRSIAKRQQQLADLNAGGDGSPMDLARADSLVSSGILTARIAQLAQRQLRIVPQIDVAVLPMAQEYAVELRTKEHQLHRVQTHREYLPDLTNEDMARLEGEYEEYTQRPDHNPVLARAMEALKRQEQAPITYADIEQRIILVGREKPAPATRRLIEAFLPLYPSEQSTIEGPDLLEAIKPGTAWEHGRKAVLGPAIYRARQVLSGTNVEIRNVGPVGGAHHVKGSYFMDIGPVPEPAEPPAPPPAPVEAAQPVPVETVPVAVLEDDFWIPRLETSATSDQRRALRAAVLRRIRGTDESKQFWADFLESEDTYAIFKSCSTFKRTKKQRFMDEEEVKLFFRHGSGSLTEWLAHYYYHPMFLQEGLTMLSPHQKFILYANAHRDKKPKANEFDLNPEIEDVPSPDSLLIKPVPEDSPEYLEVTSVVECKVVIEITSDTQKRMEDQEANYTYDNVAHHLRLNDPRKFPEMPARLGRLVHIFYPDLPALPLRVSEDMTVVYITPIDNPPLPVNIKPKTIPATTGQIGNTLTVLTGN